MTSSSSSEEQPKPLRSIPGSYGIPFIGAIKDRYQYFYTQGRENFFRSRIQKHHSTVFRANMPPGPFISSDPRVIVLLDAVSFPILFDTTKVEKRNVLDGTYMPSVDFTGGIRTCAFLDPSETEHSVLKRVFIKFLASRRDRFLPLFRNSVGEMFDKLERGLEKKGVADFNPASDAATFDFVFRLLSDHGPDRKLSSEGPGFVDRWLMVQLAPLGTLGLPKLLSCVEDLILHTFRLPFALARNAYSTIYEAFYESSATFLNEAEKQGIDREKACHNLVFLAGFNAYAGMKVLFPIILKWVGSAGEKFHRKLAGEIRAAVKEDGGIPTFAALEKMSLLKSAVYEVLRIDPPVPYQYAKAKKDIVISSHDSSFKIKKGEMIFGYQPIATKDPKVFENPEEFVGERFVGEKGEKLLKYVYWSNGRETEEPTAENKQCAAKDLVVLLARVILVELFLRYDTFAVEGTRSSLGWSVKVKSLTKSSAKG